MNNHAGERLGNARIAAMLAVTISLGGCSAGSSSITAWLSRGAPEATPAVAAAPEPIAPPARTIEAIPKSKPQGLAAAARRAEAGAAAGASRSLVPGSLAWPVHGQILRAYGEQPSGARNDGLDITAAEGSPVHAVEDGVVRYAGNDLRGYGNMLLIAHADGFTSVYAHNRALLVDVGAAVRRGQPIATVGRSGAVVEARLHFQLRAGDRPVDPEPLLEPLVSVVASLAPALASPIAAR
jgi:septal ring factor EnvC (AmiA/AmiB activator)